MTLASRRWIAPIVILFIAAFLRLYRLGDVRHNIDQAYPVFQAIGMWQNGQWPGLGQNTSVLLANPVGMSYLMFVPWALFQSAWAVHVLVILLNLLTIPLTYHVVRRIGTRPQAEVAALLAATSPWLIRYSYSTWVQGLVPLLATLTFVLIVQALFDAPARRNWRWLAASLSLTTLTQMYLLAFLSVAQVGGLVALNFRRVAWRGLLAGLAVLVLATGVYGYQIVADWPEQSARLTRFGEVASLPLAPRWTALEHAARYVTGRDYEIVYGNDGSLAWSVRHGLSLSLSVGLTLALLIGVGRSLGRILWRAPDASVWLAVLAWWCVPVLALTVTRYPLHIVYLLLTLPAGFVLVAPVLAPLVRHRLGLAMAALWVFNCFWLIQAERLSVAAHPAGDGLDHLSLNALQAFRSTATQVADVYHVTEFYVGLDEASLSAKVGQAMTTVSWSEAPTLTIFPLGQPAVYVRLTDAQPPTSIPLAQHEAEVAYSGGNSVTFDVIPAYTREQLDRKIQHPVGWPTQQGLTLIGYDLAMEEGWLTSYWLIETLAQEREQWLYAPYAHVLDAQGQIIANVSGLGLPGYYYRLNDVYVNQMELPELPAGDYQLELGLYDGVHTLGALFLPPDASPQPAYTAPLTVN